MRISRLLPYHKPQRGHADPHARREDGPQGRVTCMHGETGGKYVI